MTVRTYPRATKELVGLAVTRNDAPTTNYEVAVLPHGTPAADGSPWVAPTELDGSTGVMIDHLSPGFWVIWVRVTATPEVPIIQIDTIAIV